MNTGLNFIKNNYCTKLKNMIEQNLISDLKELFEIGFIKESFYSFIPTENAYSELLVINNKDEFFALSNGNVFVILLLQTDLKIIEKIKDKLNFIFNREKHIVSFEKTEFENEFEKITYINIDNLIEHSIKNGTCENNVFNLKLKSIFSGKTYAQHRI